MVPIVKYITYHLYTRHLMTERTDITGKHLVFEMKWKYSLFDLGLTCDGSIHLHSASHDGAGSYEVLRMNV